MAVDTNNKKLALITYHQPWNTPIPISADGLGQDDKQHLLWEYPGLLWGAPGGGYDLDIDGAMLIKNDEPYNWFILNADDGAAGVYNSDDAITNDRFDTYEKCGFDTIESALTHPWATAYADKPIWNKLGDIAEAILARSMGVDWSGTIRYRSRYEEEDGADPSAIEDITDADVPDIGSNIERATHNHVVIHGAKIIKTTEKKLMWSAHGSSIGAYTKGKAIVIADGDYWPDPDEYDDEFIAKFRTGDTGAGREGAPYDYHRDWLQDKDNCTMIGATSVVAHTHIGDADGIDPLDADFTQIFFDVLPEGVRIKYRNDAGEPMYLYQYALFGKPVYKVGGKNAINSGFIHDKFRDASDVRKNGAKVFKITNDFLIDATQINKVAEYHWRERRARHQYRQSLQGNRLYLLPGEWANVEVGSAGYHEYLDYKGEFREIHWSWDAKGTERTDVIIDEQESNWKAESNYTARFEEYGHPFKEPDAQGQTIVVGASVSADIANMYCDGTSDEDEINAAINILAAAGGGTVQLTIGTYYIDGKIVMKSNVQLVGHGHNTIIERNCNTYGIDAVGGAGTELTGIVLRDFKTTRNAADANLFSLVHFSYVDNSTIEHLLVENAAYHGIRAVLSDNNKIINCIIDTTIDQDGLYLTGTNNIVTANVVGGADDIGIHVLGNENNISNNQVSGSGSHNIVCGGNDCIIEGNTARDGSADGIYLNNSSRNIITSNQCFGNTVNGIHIMGASADNDLANNTCYNNGGRGIYIE